MLPKNNPYGHLKKKIKGEWHCIDDCLGCAYEQGRKDEAARWLEHIEGQREKIAERIMVRCEDEIGECAYLQTCPHDDKDICQWQLDIADQIINLFKEVQ